jgi:cell division protein FtsZ
MVFPALKRNRLPAIVCSRQANKKAPEPRRQLSQDAQLYAPRKGQLDDHGRASQAASEDDQLEIPAFLRRQAN